MAGFEWGSGFYINPTSPEEAAAFLRGIDMNGRRHDTHTGTGSHG